MSEEAKEPEFDADGYPTEGTLAAIREWDVKSAAGMRALLGYCERAWWARSWGWAHTKGEERGAKWIAVSTGGWSGNEEIIRALQGNRLFWALCWMESRRGGHHKFLTEPFGPEDEENDEPSNKQGNEETDNNDNAGG